LSELSRAQLEQRRRASTTHGAQSEPRVSAVATNQKRRLLRQIGLRVSDLEGIGLALLDNWARAQAKVELLDAHFAQHGLIDAAGEPSPATKLYFTALNSTRLALKLLEQNLVERHKAKGGALSSYLRDNYSD
jgi:hypothetical protein